MKDSFKVMLIIGVAVIVGLMIFNYKYYVDFKKEYQNLDISEEIKKIEEEKNNSLENIVKQKAEKYNDPSSENIEDNFTEEEIEEFFEVYKKNMENGFVLAPNAHMEDFNESTEQSYRTLVMSLIRQYQFEEASKKIDEIATKYNLIDNPEFSAFALDASNMYIFEDYSLEDQTTFLGFISDPEIFAYAFFSLELNQKNEVLLDKNSIILDTTLIPPKFVSMEEVPPRKYKADRYFISLKDFILYRMQFEVPEGNIYLYVLKDNRGINHAYKMESIDIEEYTTFAEFYDFYNN